MRPDASSVRACGFIVLFLISCVLWTMSTHPCHSLTGRHTRATDQTGGGQLTTKFWLSMWFYSISSIDNRSIGIWAPKMCSVFPIRCWPDIPKCVSRAVRLTATTSSMNLAISNGPRFERYQRIPESTIVIDDPDCFRKRGKERIRTCHSPSTSRPSHRAPVRLLRLHQPLHPPCWSAVRELGTTLVVVLRGDRSALLSVIVEHRTK